ncbi:MAG TPA: TonB-dependent receptor plug domain-containing protein [Syntrophorhabdaceae bacterium]|nr:TonB-dependent receptor plug domain-containing protein [Syntrophorhabdaceae bacterium]
MVVVRIVVIVGVLLQMVWSGAVSGEERKSLELGGIIVTAKRTGVPPEASPVMPVETNYGTQFNIVTEEQIKEQNSYDLPSTLRDVPGVMFQSKNLMGSQTNHSLYIRGRGSSHPSPDLAVMFDGVPRYGALFGQLLGDGVAVSTIGGMEVYKSPQPSRFGNGYAFVNILPRYMMKEGEEARIDSSGGSDGTFDESISAGVKKGPFDIYASQSLTRTDGDRHNSAASQQSYYINAGYGINKEWSLRLLVNYVNGWTEAPMPDRPANFAVNGVNWPQAERYKTETTFTTLTLNHEYERFNGHLKAYWNDTTFQLLQELNAANGRRFANGSGGLWSQQEIGLYGIRGRETLRLWPGGEIIAGADLDMTELKNTQRTYSGLTPTAAAVNGGLARRVWDFPDTRLFSPYAAVSHMIGRREGFHIIPSTGFRYYQHSEFESKSAPQGGLVIGYGNTDLSISYARGVNYPSPIAIMNAVLTNAPANNPKAIKPEVVDHYEAGIVHKWPDKGSLGATVFNDKGKDRFLTYMGGAVPLRFNDPVGYYEIRGLELTGAAIPAKDLELFAAATWLTVEAKGADNVESSHMPYTPGFQFQAGAKWRFFDRFRVFADMQHLRDLYQGASAGVGRGNTLNLPVLTSKDKLGDITLVNARVSYRFDYRPMGFSNSEVFVAVNNIFNQDYEYAKGYPMPGTTFFGGVSLKFN